MLWLNTNLFQMKKVYIAFILFFILYSTYDLKAQYTFDNCQYAKSINISNDYCSNDAEFTNEEATPDPEFPNGCVFLKFQNGVWFSFIPLKTAVSIRVFGSGLGGTMKNPKIVIFEDCNTYLSCSPGSTESTDELVIDDLIIGKTYYIMIESSVGGEGSFKLCIDGFTPVPSPESDCKDGVVLCDKSSFIVESLIGAGQDKYEIDSNSCIQEEFASSWHKWTCDNSGSLTFTLTPNNNDLRITDDLDFAVYELPNGIDDCTGKKMIRCMGSGANGDGNGNPLPLSQWADCNGPTGLRSSENDFSEDPGCNNNSNNFIAPLNMVSGRSYVLIVNNYSRSGLGFKIDFGGTGTFLGPKADFDIDALNEFECDKTIRFTNKSTSQTDQIISYSWAFGDGSAPIRSSNEGPIDVIYDSFGNKIVALTIESSRGCLVTKYLPIFVESCCADFTLNVEGESTNPICSKDKNGSILGKGSEGNPPYKYSIDGKNFQTVPIFYDLGAGKYNLFIQDRKGCRDSIIIGIIDPKPIIVDAGPDQTINLGDHTTLDGDYLPPEYDVVHVWTPNYNMIDSSELDTEVWPYDDQKYTLTVVQEETGCTAQDDMVIYVNKNRKIRIPNVFTPNGDGKNDYFTAYNVKAAIEIDQMFIYDRWGELVYKANKIPLGNNALGWDGDFKGQKVNPGVYVYLFMIRFLDDKILPFSGDITVIR